MEKQAQRKAVIYCRVSTKEQVEEGNSLVTQERNCREYAFKNNYVIVNSFIEEGESAKTADRTELKKLLRFCADKKQQIKAVIIYKIDRLSRNTDDYSQLRILLKRYDIEIKSTSEYFENTPAGRFMENIIANVAQFDNDVRTERSVGGLKEAIREGRYVWMAPVGYVNAKVNGKTNIVQSDKAPLVKLAFEMMADRKGSVNNIRDSLSQLGLPLARSHFYKMLNNKIYFGCIEKMGEVNKGIYEPIISQELFNRVQALMSNKKMPMLYKTKHPDFPLRRFVKHPVGSALTGAWAKGRSKKYAYYRFIKIGLQWPKIDVETAFHSFMDKYAFDPDLILKLKNEVINRFSNNSENAIKDIEKLNAQKKQLKDKQRALLGKNIAGIISDQLLKEHLTTLDDEIWNIDRKLSQNEEDKIDVKKIFSVVDAFLLQPSLTWRSVSLEIQIKLQWFQFPQGVVFDGTEFRTTEISSLFKVKSFFLSQLSSNADHQRLLYEHNKLANFPSVHTDDIWEGVREELVRLEEIIHPREETDDPAAVYALAPPWAA